MTQKTAFDFLESISALRCAKLGDMRPLAERILQGTALTSDERAFIAACLLGEVKVDRRRMLKDLKNREREDYYCYVEVTKELFGGSQESAVQEAMDHFRVDRKTIFNALQCVRGRPERQAALDEQVVKVTRWARDGTVETGGRLKK